jgi:integrase
MLLRRGANAKQAQVGLGQQSPSFTVATYVHLLPEDAPDPSFLDELGLVSVAAAHEQN